MTAKSDQDLYAAMAERLPAFPESVRRILDMTGGDDCAPKDLVAVIERDPVMTMKILKLVNSAWFGLATRISSVNQGIVYVGINAIKNVALTIAAMGMLPARNAAGMDRSDFLLHSLGVASIARRLARHLGATEAEATDSFVAGLLHDFGKILLAQHYGDEYRAIIDSTASDALPLYLGERAATGSDHAALGSFLAESWHLSPTLIGAIRHHHEPECDGEWSLVRDCVFAANQVVRSLGVGDSGNPMVAMFPGPIRCRFGRDLEALLGDLGDLSPEIEEARLFMQQ